MRSRPGLSVLLTLVVVFGSLVATTLAGFSPILGLDLQGGISVVLAPVRDDVASSSIDKAVDIVRDRVDALGVAEPEISRQGDRIIVDLPGVKDRDRASRLVGKTAELRFRPVVGCLPPEGEQTASTTTTTTAPVDPTATTAPVDPTTTTAPADTANPPTTPPEDDVADQEVVLEGSEPCQPVEEGDSPAPRYQLGPTALTGTTVTGATARIDQVGQWSVEVELRDGGSEFIEKVAQPYVNQRVAIVLDQVVQSAPTIQPDILDGLPGGSVQITGQFSESEAKDLEAVLDFGALPVELKTETIQNVSPSLGRDQLRAGVIAGIVGLALVAIYMLAFYRVLGLVVISGLGITFAAMWALVSYLGETVGLALTLAGVTGLIVSVGVTVDSYVVYFERLKDEVRSGKTVRSSLDRGFRQSFRTILAADLVSLIGALILYLLAIGSVRGFAFFLGLSTLIDLLVTYFYMHPLVVLMARRRALVTAPKVGIAAGLDTTGATA